jgi:hypothetical protein
LVHSKWSGHHSQIDKGSQALGKLSSNGNLPFSLYASMLPNNAREYTHTESVFTLKHKGVSYMEYFLAKQKPGLKKLAMYPKYTSGIATKLKVFPVHIWVGLFNKRLNSSHSNGLEFG